LIILQTNPFWLTFLIIYSTGNINLFLFLVILDKVFVFYYYSIKFVQT